jgi:PAS domain S-box-containing protein
MLRRLILSLLAICMVLFTAVGASEADEAPVRVGILSFRPPAIMRTQWAPTIEYLESVMPGRKFELRLLKYQELDAALESHQLDFMVTNPEHFVLRRGAEGMSAIATLMPLAEGHPVTQFGGVIFCRSERQDLLTLADVRGKRIASPNAESLGGYLMQRWELLKAGIDLGEESARVKFTGLPHDNAVTQVLDGSADVGFVRTGVLEAMAREGKLDLKLLRIINRQPGSEFPQIHSTALYPEWPVVALARTPEPLVKQVTRALLDISPESDAARSGHYYGFSPPGDYTPVEAIMLRMHVHPGRLDHFDTLDVMRKYALHLQILAAAALLIATFIGVRLYRNAMQIRAAASERELLLSSLGDGVCGINRAGICTFVNQSALNMLGYAREDLIGKSLHRLTHHHHADGSEFEESECGLMYAMTDGFTRVEESWFLRKDGTGFSVRYTASPIWEHGQVTGLVAIIRDITERKLTERELERHRHHLEELVAERTAGMEAARMEADRLSRVKSEFLANMSHELRTPLNGVLGMAQIGYRESVPGSAARLAFAKIMSSGKLLFGIINDILDFSKIEAGKLQIEHTDMDLHALLHLSMDLVRERADEKQLQLVVETGNTLPDRCVSDPLRMGQILLNLLSNAVKFTPQGQVTLGAALDGSTLVISVSDTGIGMTPEQIKRIFAPFEQGDGSTTRKFGGTGLGLTITHRLVELMGGEISVMSELGSGTRFEVRLPYVESHSLPESLRTVPFTPHHHEEGRLKGISVLVAEDNEVNRIVMEEHLRSEGALVVMVGDGGEAIERIRIDGPRAFDIVLMDIQMPNINGHEATKRIIEIAPQLPIVGQTAHAFAEERAACFASGMVDHIAKPIDPLEMITVILRHAGSRTGGMES